MRNALNKLADTVQDPAEKKVSNLHTPHAIGSLFLMTHRWDSIESVLHRRSRNMANWSASYVTETYADPA
jgi:hypothetical protein